MTLEQGQHQVLGADEFLVQGPRLGLGLIENGFSPSGKWWLHSGRPTGKWSRAL